MPKKQTGDAIAIILLCEDGIVVDGAKHIRTGLDVIRGLQITPDGKYAPDLRWRDRNIRDQGSRGEEWVKVAEEKSVVSTKEILHVAVRSFVYMHREFGH